MPYLTRLDLFAAEYGWSREEVEQMAASELDYMEQVILFRRASAGKG